MSGKEKQVNVNSELSDLQSLISSLNFDTNITLTSTLPLPTAPSSSSQNLSQNPTLPSHHLHHYAHVQQNIGSKAAKGLIPSPVGKDISSIGIESSSESFYDMRDLLQSVHTYPTIEDEPKVEDVDDYRVLHFGTSCTFRGRNGRYINAIPMSVAPSSNKTVAAASKSNIVFVGGTDGQGINDPLGIFVLLPPDVKRSEEKGSIRYGDTVCIKSLGAKERYLGTREDNSIGFWRNLCGQREKWIILKGSPRGVEERNSRGLFVRTGDFIMLQTPEEMMLSFSDGISGKSLKLIHRDRAAVGDELWQIDWNCSQPTPSWLTQRPYLSGSYLLQPPNERYNVNAEVMARNFPGTVVKSEEKYSSADLCTFPPPVQEGILIRELILALGGIEGAYVRVAATRRDGKPLQRLKDICFVIDNDTSDRGLTCQIALLLPICENAIHIREYINNHSRFEYGMVSHSVAAVMKDIMRTLDLIVAQLEHLLSVGQITLQKMVYLLQPAKSTLRSLDHLVTRIQNCVGGELLDKLQEALLEQGDEKLRILHENIVKAAAEPFLKTLSRWLFKGELIDPYYEFFIQENVTMTREALQEDFNAHYWEGRYTLRRRHTPKILRNHAEKALTAGKYLNVIRDCLTGITVHDTYDGDETLPVDESVFAAIPERELTFDIDGTTQLVGAIEFAYQNSSNNLLKLLEEKYNLSSHIRSLRRFFLLEHGDFFLQFMDTANEELSREAKDVAIGRVQSLLQLALHTSTLSLDPHKENLTCVLASHNLIQHLHLIQAAGEGVSVNALTGADSFSVLGGAQGLKGVEALTLEYKVGWPLSIILSKRAVTKYQLLSRLLFFSKHVESKVLECWQDHQNTKELGLRRELGPSLCLRHRMLHFLQNFVYYMTIEVFNPRSHEMVIAMENAKDMDEVINLHELFLDTCLKECLLASQDLLRILTKITTTCLLFAEKMKLFRSSTYHQENERRLYQREDRFDRIKDQSQMIVNEVTHESYVSMLGKFAKNFDDQLREFLEKLWKDSNRHHPQLANLCVRLDYNGFYNSIGN